MAEVPEGIYFLDEYDEDCWIACSNDRSPTLCYEDCVARAMINEIFEG